MSLYSMRLWRLTWEAWEVQQSLGVVAILTGSAIERHGARLKFPLTLKIDGLNIVLLRPSLPLIYLNFQRV